MKEEKKENKNMLPNKTSVINTRKDMFPDKKSTSKQMKTSTLTNAAGLNSLITFTVLLLAWISGFASRLFAVIRFESIIHEFDPWYVFLRDYVRMYVFYVIKFNLVRKLFYLKFTYDFVT